MWEYNWGELYSLSRRIRIGGDSYSYSYSMKSHWEWDFFFLVPFFSAFYISIKVMGVLGS